MIRHNLEQHSFNSAAPPLPLQSNTYPPPYQEQAMLLASSHGHSGVHAAYAAPGLASPLQAGAAPTVILSVALLLTLLLCWSAWREVLRLRRVLGRYRDYFRISPAQESFAALVHALPRAR